MTNTDGKETGEDTQEPTTFEDLVADLPLDDEKKKMVSNLVAGLVTSLNQLTTRLENLEKQPASDNPDIYEGLSGEQRYNVLMAKASAPAAAAQQGLLQAFLARSAGGGGGGDLAGLLKSAETIQALRSVISPEQTPVQLAMEKAQVAAVLAQTRLMNKVAGKATSDYLETIEKEITEPGGEEN